MNENSTNEIYCEIKVTDHEKIQSMRTEIDKWIKKRTLDPRFDNFGLDIEIVEVVEKPTYIITLKSLYEERQLWKRPFPWDSKQDIIEDDGGIDIWAIHAETSDDFEEVTQKYKVEKSEIIENCIECKSKGIVVCGSCDGGKKVTCSRCSGDGVLKCSACDGQGIIKCKSCRGTGKKKESKYINGRSVSREVNCTSCLGRGHLKCDKCKDGLIACSDCNKKGEILCPECNGRGIVHCYCCKGKKTVSSFKYVSITHTPNQQIEFANHTSHPPDIINNISAQRDTGLLIYEDTKISPNDIVFQCNEDSINNICNKMIFKSKTSLGDNCHLIKQQLMVSKIPVYLVSYIYSSKAYSLWINGDNIIWTSSNPIFELADSFYNSATEAFSNKKRAQALKLINRAFYISPTSDDINKLKKNIGRSYILSWITKGVLIIALPLLLLALIGASFGNVKNDEIALIAIMIAIIALIFGGGLGVIIGIIGKNVIQTKSKKSL